MWKYKTGDSIGSVAITQDGSKVVAGTKYNNIYLFSSEGKLMWKYKTGDSIGSVAITQDGSKVVAGTKYNNIYLFANLKRLSSIAILKAKEKLQEANKLEVEVLNAEDLLNQAQTAFDKYESIIVKDITF